MGDVPTASERARVEVIVDATRSILDGAKDLARRSRHLSWSSWGFLYAAWGGVALLVFLVLFFPMWASTSTGAGGVVSTDNPPLWYIPLAFAPAIVLLFWAVHGVFAGRAASREALRGVPRGTSPPSGRDDSPGWTQQVVEAQKLLTAAKLETDWSFLPLGIGLLACDSFIGNTLITILGGNGFPDPYLPLVVGAAIFLVALVFLYRVAQEWVGGFQKYLDRQVREVSALEAEFLWRFAGSPA